MSEQCLTTLGEIASIRTGKLDANAQSPDGAFPFFTCGDEVLRIDTPAFDAEAVLLAGNGNFGVKYYKGKFNAYQRTYVIEPRGVDGKWLFYLVRRHIARITSSARGSTIPYLRLGDIANCEVSLPPLAEQKRIVAKIEELFSELEAGEESLRAARRQLGVYRQSLLKQAFEGKLTETWRTENPDKLESPAQLLARIQSARQARYEEELKEWESSERDKRRPRKLEDSAPLTAEELSGLPELPDHWQWVHPDALASHEPYSLGIGPFGSNLKVSDYTESGVPLVFVKNITRNDFSLEPRFVSEAKAEELSAHTTIGGDLLITKMGDPPGDCAIYPLGAPKAVITADCLKFRLLSDYCQRGFYCSFINSVVCRKQLGFITRGVAQKKISVERFKSIAVPFCSLPEQQEIVRLLDEQFEAIERNEREIDAALKRSEALRQAILKKAFTGQLVPQAPADEPASALLARIRAESATTAPSSKVRRTRSA